MQEVIAAALQQEFCVCIYLSLWRRPLHSSGWLHEQELSCLVLRGRDDVGDPEQAEHCTLWGVKETVSNNPVGINPNP